MHTILGESFGGQNFRVFHGFAPDCENFPVNDSNNASLLCKMVLLKKQAKPSVPAILPSQNRQLCKDVLSSSIREADLCITEALQTAGKHKIYLKSF